MNPSIQDQPEAETTVDRLADAYRQGVCEALAWAARQSTHLTTHCTLVRASLLARAIRTARTPPPVRVLDEIAARLAEPDRPTTTRRSPPKERGARGAERGV